MDILVGQLAVTQNVTLPQQTVRDMTKWMGFKPSLSANLAQNLAKNAQPIRMSHWRHQVTEGSELQLHAYN